MANDLWMLLWKFIATLVIHSVFAKLPAFEKVFPKANDKLAEESLALLHRALDQMEIMLGEGNFLQNSDEVSIADLSLLCELTQLQVLYMISNRFLSQLQD